MHLELGAVSAASAARAPASSASTRSPSGTANGLISNGEVQLPSARAVGASTTFLPAILALARPMATRGARGLGTPVGVGVPAGGEAPHAADDGADADAPALGVAGVDDVIVFAGEELAAHALEAHVGPRGAGGARRVEPDGDERAEIGRGRRSGGLLRPARTRQHGRAHHTRRPGDESSSRQHDAVVPQAKG